MSARTPRPFRSTPRVSRPHRPTLKVDASRMFASPVRRPMLSVGVADLLTVRPTSRLRCPPAVTRFFHLRRSPPSYLVKQPLNSTRLLRALVLVVEIDRPMHLPVTTRFTFRSSVPRQLLVAACDLSFDLSSSVDVLPLTVSRHPTSRLLRRLR